MHFKDLPIQRKLRNVILFISCIVLAIMCGAYVFFEHLSYKDILKNNLSTLAVVMAANSSAALAFDSHSDARDVLNALKTNKHILAAALYDKNGDLFARYPDTISTKLLPAKPGRDGYVFENSVLQGYEPVLQRSDRLGTLMIRSDMEEMYAQMRHFLLVAIILMCFLLIFAYLLSNVLQKTISQPILSLEATARIVSQHHDYTVRAEKTGGDELGSLTDTFNQMLAQIELQNIEKKNSAIESSRLAAIVASSYDAIISKSLDGIITSWNNSAEKIFGHKADEMIGQTVLKIIPPAKQHEEPQIIARIKNGERIEFFETQRMTKNGDLIDVSLTISPIHNDKGDIVGVSKIVRDITEKKQEERKKNDFIAIVSHELKTPLTSMRTYIQVLLHKVKNGGDTFQINALTRADIQAKKMTNMIQDFLSLARLEEGKIQIHKHLFDLHPLILEVSGEAQYLTTTHEIAIDDCDDVQLNADKDKIGQVLMNLLSNAIKYSPKGGKITIGCEKLGKSVKIYVSDEGVGISTTDQKRLFDRFYRVTNDKVKTVSGFGIGLYLVSEILRYHGSKIEVKSEEGVGSTFYFMMELQ